MADLMESLSTLLSELIGGGQPKVIVSDAPGGGPEVAGEEKRVQILRSHNGSMPLGYLSNSTGYGRNNIGFGGSGDAVVVDEHGDEEVKAAIAEAVRIARVSKQFHEVTPAGRYRMGKWFWLEGHSDNTTGPTMGPYSLFDGTITAPGAGNSVQTIPISVPPGTVSPIFLLDRYPGVFYMSLFISSFAFVPTGSTMTGLQECWFSDITGATAGLGIYNAASQGNDFENINKQLSGPLTDPGLNTIGNLVVNNIGIGGTPVSVRYQLSIGFIGFLADPWFNEQMLVPPTPAQQAQHLRLMEAQG